MSVELLNTKLYIPSVRPNLLPRPRLFDQLALTPANRLFLISAPAGYGKSTLVSSWLEANPSPTAWLSLDASDNDPIQFLQYLIRALEPIIPSVKIELPGMLQGLPTDSQLNRILNVVGQQPCSFVLVLDDFHLIQSQSVLDLVTVLIERMPPQIRVILISRTDPPLPLARWRTRHQMVEIRADQLRLTKDELAGFFKLVMPLELLDDDLLALEARTEGWIAGVQLAALSMQGCTDLHGFVAAFTGSHHYIMDYLLDEVLKRQPEPVRMFLLKTSILSRLCGALCESVIGGTMNRLEGQAMLEDIERRNLFLVPLDNERHWYRYHHLFADVLNRHLERVAPEQIPELHRRAAEWLEQNGSIAEAIQHSVLAQEHERAVRLVEQNGCLLLMAGEVETLNQWLQAVTPYAPTHPWFAILKGWILTLTGRQDQVAPVLQSTEQLLASLEPTPTVQIMRGALITAYAHSASWQGDPSAAQFARQALGVLPEGDTLADSLRSVATLILGDASWRCGDLQQASHAYAEASRIGHIANNPHLIILGNADLADILIEQGQLQLAAKKLSEALAVATRPDGTQSLMVDRVLAGLSRVAYAENDLPVAEHYARQCIQLCQETGSLEFEAVGHVILARLAQIQCHPQETIEAMRAAERLPRDQISSLRLSTWVQCALARLWLDQGNVEQVNQFLRKQNIPNNDAITYLQEPGYLIRLRMSLAQMSVIQ